MLMRSWRIMTLKSSGRGDTLESGCIVLDLLELCDYIQFMGCFWKTMTVSLFVLFARIGVMCFLAFLAFFVVVVLMLAEVLVGLPPQRPACWYEFGRHYCMCGTKVVVPL